LGTVSAGSGVNFIPGVGGSVNITGAANTNGILNAHLYYNGADFAAGSAVGAATYTDQAAALAAALSTPTRVTGSFTQATAVTVNAGVKFDSAQTLTLSGATGIVTINNGAGTAGGLLVTGGNTVTIAGTGAAGFGITSGGAGDLVFRTNLAGDTLNLNVPILATTTGGWTKLGAGTLVLGVANANTTAGSVHIE